VFEKFAECARIFLHVYFFMYDILRSIKANYKGWIGLLDKSSLTDHVTMTSVIEFDFRVRRKFYSPIPPDGETR
jgi:hypothetical protein